GGVHVSEDGTVDMRSVDIEGGGLTLAGGRAELADAELRDAPACAGTPCRPGRSEASIVVGAGSILTINGETTISAPPGAGVQVDTAPPAGQAPGQVTAAGPLVVKDKKKPAEPDVFTPTPGQEHWYWHLEPIVEPMRVDALVHEN